MLFLLAHPSAAFAKPFSKTLKKGAGHLLYKRPSKTRKPIKIWYYAPASLKKTSPILFVMHGVKRNGKDYRDSWIKESDETGFLVIAPEFAAKDYPKSAEYNLGGLYDREGRARKRDDWSFTAIDEIFDHFKSQYGFKVPRYFIYGHSAGAQFVQRLVLFCPDAKIRKAFAANAGWYTSVDETIKFPYGLENSPQSISKSQRIFKLPLILLLGDQDTNPKHKYLRTTKMANRQGPHRYARGEHFYAQAKTVAAKKAWPFAWEKVSVKGVGHSNKGMLKAAAKLIRKETLGSD
ncbi:MAG: hypothetical protein P1V97_16850 [Planctomycetota bacterium]|nr:hypothetical protein [Planctomycetota bacterium]